jgi:hypothetical protein
MEVWRAFPQEEELVTPTGSEPSSRKSWKDAVAKVTLASVDTRIVKRPISSQGWHPRQWA